MRMTAAPGTISAKTKYLQLRDQLLAGILGGDYPAGSRLPSIEAIRGSWGVSQATAVRAIELLADAGLIERRAGRGTYVRHTLGDAEEAPVIKLAWAAEALDRDIAPLLGGPLRRASPDDAATPEAYSVTPSLCADLARAGSLIPLDGYLAEDPVLAEALDELATGAFRVAGSLYAAPVYVSPLSVHLNLDALAEAGIETPMAEWGWDDMRQVAERLREKGWADPVAWSWPPAILFPLLAAQGARLGSGADRGLRLTSMRRAFETLRDLAQTWGPPSESKGQAAYKQFAGGAAPALLWGALPWAEAPPFRHAQIPLPGGEATPSVIFAEGIGISAAARRPELLWGMIRRRFLGPEASEALVRRGVAFPPRRASILDFIARGDGASVALYRALGRATTRHMALGVEKLNVLRAAVDGWWRPNTDLNELLTHAQRVMDAVLNASAAPDAGGPQA